MLPTPSTSHTNYDRVYEPAEDSFLFLDLLSSPKETAYLTDRFQLTEANGHAPLVVEVGIGSGVVLAFVTAHAQAILGHPHVLTLGTDINAFACESSRKTVEKACDEACPSSKLGFLGTTTSDLVGPLRHNEVDILIFNPPYVPSESVPFIHADSSERVAGFLQHDSVLLSLSYEGGADGMEVTQRLLDQLPLILNRERGVAYILLCQQNKPEVVAEKLRQSGWVVEIVARSGMKAGWEKLQILRISHSTGESLN